MSIVTILLNIFLPPLAVFLKHGLGMTFLISLILTAIGWLPGVIHAFIVNREG
ncbi:YqaE/Pmp3 family membrane protein [Cellulophaga sp. HaHaR_3_176]|uniref:YqaE/Pmp3 family membrane protein n=1 Tax=Cellulophaga sp. HaHaR_3_176 TaxID=1942464 RepID=UPI001C1FAC88|nr:YqaE/Pmp3 family membrane protein [Cellulophaga sp. HaHaR_3_176]QWX85025.1 YqaE/Pmp3 family membrane protein [Cellulophaga sp. HaHaR_3_176]